MDNMSNKKLHNAKRNKNDEFYTQLPDIENELHHYWDHFKGKTVLCNCDDPKISNFHLYFTLKFDDLKLSKLITVCYKNNQMDLFSEKNDDQAIAVVYTKVENGVEEKVIHLKGDGDFRSDECVQFLKESDIVVTNPPFSLFREYIAQLMEHDKKFLIIGNYNAVTYKEVFPLIKENKIWLGYSLDGRNIWFGIPDHYEKYHKIEDGVKYAFVAGTVWFTNLDHKKRNEELILVKNYKGNEQNYPKYDNYNAIEVSKVVDIPKDYDGVMGVPITFLNKYNPDQFEIMNANDFRTNEYVPMKSHGLIKDKEGSINGKPTYVRILIRRK